MSDIEPYNENKVLLPPEDCPNQPETNLYIPVTGNENTVTSNNLVDLESMEFDQKSQNSENQEEIDDPFGINNNVKVFNNNLSSPGIIENFPDFRNNTDRNEIFKDQLSQDDFQNSILATPSKYDSNQNLVNSPESVNSDGFGSHVNTPNNDGNTMNNNNPKSIQNNDQYIPNNNQNPKDTIISPSKQDKVSKSIDNNGPQHNPSQSETFQRNQSTHNDKVNNNRSQSTHNDNSNKQNQFRLLSNKRLQDVTTKQYQRLIDYHQIDLLSTKDVENLQMRYWYKSWDMLESTGIESEKVRNLVNSYNDNIYEIIQFYSEVNIYTKAVNKSSTWRTYCLGFILALEVILYNVLNIHSAKGLYDIHFQSMFLYEDDINEIAYQNVNITEPESSNKSDPMTNLIKSFCFVTVIYMTINLLIGSDNEEKVQSLFSSSTKIYQDVNKNNKGVIGAISENKDSVHALLNSTIGNNAKSIITPYIPGLGSQ